MGKPKYSIQRYTPNDLTTLERDDMLERDHGEYVEYDTHMYDLDRVLSKLEALVEKVEHFDHRSWEWPQYKEAIRLLVFHGRMEETDGKR